MLSRTIRIIVLFWSMIECAETDSLVADEVLKRYEKITKSSSDTRSYRGLELSNRMKVLLISDSKTVKSAAFVNIGVGSLNDSRGVPGLAHLVVSMVPAASKQHPDNMFEFDKFVSTRGGNLKLNSMLEEQSFGYEVNSDCLAETLIRFSEFLLEPLLSVGVSEEWIDNAVRFLQNQYESNIKNDAFRITEAERLSSKENHAYNHFHDGNEESLYEHAKDLPKRLNKNSPDPKKWSLIDKIRQFHSAWYSANIMNLAVLGKESLDELESMVVPLFKNVPNKKARKIIYPPEYHPWWPDHTMNLMFVLPLLDDAMILRLNFPILDIRGQYKTAPEKYLHYLLEQRGPGSLFSALQRRELCDSMNVQTECTAGFGILNVSFNLTAQGVDNVGLIINLFFQYVLLLTERGIKKELFDELQQIQDLKFKYDQPEDIEPFTYVMDLASDMHYYPIDDILSHHHLLEEWDPSLIQKLLALLKPENMNVTVVGKSMAWLTNKKGPYYQVDYSVEKVSDKFIKRWKPVVLNPEFELPLSNEFIPRNFDLFKVDKKGKKEPYVFHKSLISEIWFKPDDSFSSPKLSLEFELFSKRTHLNASQRFLWYIIFDRRLTPLLKEHFYSAHAMGFKLEIKVDHYKIMVKLYGFHDTMPKLLKKLLSKINNLISTIDEDNFNTLKQEYVGQLSRGLSTNPLLQGKWYLEQLQYSGKWSVKNDLNAAKTLQYGHLREFLSKVFRRIFIRGLVHGNCTEQKAMELVNILEQSFSTSRGMLPSEVLQPRTVELTNDSHFVYQALIHLDNFYGYSAYYQLHTGSSDFHNNVASSLFAEVVIEPCKTVQRDMHTSNTTCQSLQQYGVRGFMILMMSMTTPKTMDLAVEKLLRNISRVLADETNAQFEMRKASLEAKYYAPAKHLDEVSDRYWHEIHNRFYIFNRIEKELKVLRSFKKMDLVKFFEEMFGSSSTGRRRRKIAVHLFPNNKRKENLGLLGNMPAGANKVESQYTFHNNMNLLPLSFDH